MLSTSMTGVALLPSTSALDQLKRTTKLLGPLPAWQLEHLRTDPDLRGSIASTGRAENTLHQR